MTYKEEKKSLLNIHQEFNISTVKIKHQKTKSCPAATQDQSQHPHPLRTSGPHEGNKPVDPDMQVKICRMSVTRASGGMSRSPLLMEIRGSQRP